MTVIDEGNLRFSFSNQFDACKYDDWSFYRNQFQSIASGSKAVDILCLDANAAWLIEVKDYRQHKGTKAINLSDEVARKVRDTLAGLAAASANANDADEKRLARKALKKHRWRVVLHLEQPIVTSRLRPQPYDRASIIQKLRSKLLKAIDAHPVVLERNSSRQDIPWNVQSLPFTAN